jgi:endoribonuclease Dicer
LINSFKKDEDRMNMEIANRTSNETFIGSEERTYKVDSSGASISSGYSISLLHQYCAKLPRDEYALALLIIIVSIQSYVFNHLKAL